MQIQLQIGQNYYTAEYDMSSQTYEIIGPAAPGYGSKTDTILEKQVAKEDYGGNSTSITVEEVYNQLILTCDQEDLETVVDSPVTEEEMSSPYSNKVLWAKEYLSEGEGESAFSGFKDMIRTDSTNYDGAVIFEHYMRSKKSNIWSFNGDEYIGGNYNQEYIMRRARAGSCLAFLASFGSVERVSDSRDNAVYNDIKLSDYMVIAVNGNKVDKTEDSRYSHTYHRWPSDDVIKNSQPIAWYTGNLSSGNISPADANQTNYLVISGEFTNVPADHCAMHSTKTSTLDYEYPSETQGTVDGQTVYTSTPLEGVPYDWPSLKTLLNQDEDLFRQRLWHHTKPVGSNDDGAYYFVKFFNNGNAKTVANEESLYPFNQKWDKYADL
jgi:hypothetical protein